MWMRRERRHIVQFRERDIGFIKSHDQQWPRPTPEGIRHGSVCLGAMIL